MAYNIHITRRDDWVDEGQTITNQEWVNLLKNNKDLLPTNKSEDEHVVIEFSVPLAKWKNNYFMFHNGIITVKSPDDETLQKMRQIAKQLSAKIQGDDREIYADYTEILTQIKQDYRKLRKANLPEGFPVIDHINRDTKVVTKMEAIDLTASEFQEIETIEKVIKNYIKKLTDLNTIVWDNNFLKWGRDFDKTFLEIAIPAGKATAEQRDTLLQLQNYAQDNNVRLIINEVE